MMKRCPFILLATLAGVPAPGHNVFVAPSSQPMLGVRNTQILLIDGLRFRDSNHNRQLDPFEDWRLSPEARTADLMGRLSLENIAGLLVHGTLQPSGNAETSGTDHPGYDLERAGSWIVTKHVNSFVTRLEGTATDMAVQNNRIQEIAEKSEFGIPVTISCDPKRHHFQQMLGDTVQNRAFSLWPEALGFAAIGDAELTRRFGDTVRREYLAVGIRESLAPQADLATEPRWTRTAGTFGEDAALASRMVEAYITGVQNGANGLDTGSVAAVVKHWAGYGAAKDGWDSHSYYGRFSTFEPGRLAYHLEPYEGAFKAHVAGVMPSYSILEGASVGGKPLEQVGVGFNHQMLEELLRGQKHFNGVVLSDWLITRDCSEFCQNGTPAGTRPQLKDAAMPWGVETLTKAQRFAKAINAGTDQIGGTEEANLIAEDVRNGLIPEARVREAAARVLLQKFQLGLFEQPYVDERQAGAIAGNPSFVREGEAAQARAVVLLKNEVGPKHRPLLPIREKGRKIYLYGVSADAAERAGFVVVSDPRQAVVAIVRAPPPYGSEHPNYFFGARQHEGRLDFTSADAGYAELQRVSRVAPTIFVTTLERPLILTNVKPYAAALLGDFGIADDPLFALVTGKSAPEGKLPFELPSSVKAVQAQKSDLPHDSVAPLYPFGFGLRYAPGTGATASSSPLR